MGLPFQILFETVALHFQANMTKVYASSFQSESVVLKINFHIPQRKKPNIHIVYDCSNISGFLTVIFGGLGEATNKTAENNGHAPKTIIFIDLYTILGRWLLNLSLFFRRLG